MSKYIEVSTNFTDRKVLIQTLEALGFKIEKAETRTVNSLTGRSYAGARSFQANVIVRRADNPTMRLYSDTGFEYKNGKYIMHTDDLDIQHSKVKDIKKEYAARRVMAVARARGYAVHRKDKDGVVKINVVMA